VDFLPVVELKGAAAGRAAVTLGAIRGLAMPVNGFGLLADGAENGQLNHPQNYDYLRAQHTYKKAPLA